MNDPRLNANPAVSGVVNAKLLPHQLSGCHCSAASPLFIGPDRLIERLLKIIHKLRNFCVVKAKRRLASEHGPALRLNRRKEALWMRILIVEDEVGLAHYIFRALLEAGHDPVLVHDGETAIGEVQEKRCQVIILDVMLPGIDGFEVLRRLRAAKVDSRVLILTARGEVTDRVTGLTLGADDYLAKPFAMRELVARVTALGRRFPEKAPVKFQVADLILNAIDGKLYRANHRIELSPRERTLLRVLMREPGRIFSRTELCERVWEREHEYDMKLVECFISRLRKKIDSPPLIHTVRHLGYMIRNPESETGHYRGTSRFARRALP
jgi:DNA-binding response OmpR family regulator